ncbi:MAG: hypothetical protein M1831_002154 [Alyxoria varia]|nr:MAG: hypothetical protein M1831_002154 [Alyxoria varia]
MSQPSTRKGKERARSHSTSHQNPSYQASRKAPKGLSPSQSPEPEDLYDSENTSYMDPRVLPVTPRVQHFDPFFVPSDPRNSSIDFFFNTIVRFAGSPQESASDWLSELTDLYTHAPQDSHLSIATVALSYASFGTSMQNESLLNQGRIAYGKSLATLNHALKDPVQSKEDATLMTVLVLGYWEFVMSTYEDKPFSDAHGEALPLLLKHRGKEQLEKSIRSKRLFHTVQNQIINACIHESKSAEQLLGDLSIVEDDPGNPGIHLRAIFKKINDVQVLIDAIRSGGDDDDESRDSVQTAFQKAKAVDRELVNWTSTLRSEWQYTIVEGDQICFDPKSYRAMAHVYKDLWICRIWNFFRTARVKLHTATWDLASWAGLMHGADYSKIQQHSQETVRRMVEDICATVPFCLGNKTILDKEPIAKFPPTPRQAMAIGWFLALVPLRVANNTPHISQDQQTWISNQLSRVCKIGAAYMGSRTSRALLRETLPTFVFAFPINTVADSETMSRHFDPDSGASPGDDGAMSPTAMPELKEFRANLLTCLHDEQARPSNSTDTLHPDRAARPRSSRGRSPGDSGGGSVSASQSPRSQSRGFELQFYNTTKPDQIKDKATQKKIRRDVMLHHVRMQDAGGTTPKAENRRRARGASSAEPNANTKERRQSKDSTGLGSSVEESSLDLLYFASMSPESHIDPALTVADRLVLRNLLQDIAKHQSDGTGKVCSEKTAGASTAEQDVLTIPPTTGKVEETSQETSDDHDDDVRALAALKALNNPKHAEFEPTVFVSTDLRDLQLPVFARRYLLDPYIRWASGVVRNPTDVVMLTHLILYFTTSVPSAMVLLFYRFTWLHGALHSVMQLYYVGTYTLMMHQHIHMGGILAKKYALFDRLFPYITDPLMGHTWNSYYHHHVKHHHVESNGPDDLSSTIRYQRDSLPDFLRYVSRFVFFVWLDLPLYFLRKQKPALALRAAFWESADLAAIALMAWFVSPRATCFVLVIPLVMIRMGLMVGNWGQHAFVDEEEPDSDFRTSITLIDVASNRYCYSDGYHTSHHLNPLRHWRDHPSAFLAQKHRYASEQALVFRDIDYIMLTVRLLRKDYAHLARCMVPMGEAQCGMGMGEREEMLRRKTRRFGEREIRGKFGR